jgi:hypothetical protein
MKPTAPTPSLATDILPIQSINQEFLARVVGGEYLGEELPYVREGDEAACKAHRDAIPALEQMNLSLDGLKQKVASAQRIGDVETLVSDNENVRRRLETYKTRLLLKCK